MNPVQPTRRITFEQWNEAARRLKPGRNALLADIENEPGEFVYFENGIVTDASGRFVIKREDYI